MASPGPGDANAVGETKDKIGALMTQAFHQSKALRYAQGGQGELAWETWWPALEKEVRTAVEAPVKGFYDSKCVEMLFNFKSHLRSVFERNLVPGSDETRIAGFVADLKADPLLAPVMPTLERSQLLASLVQKQTAGWIEVWRQTEQPMKDCVLIELRKQVKSEIRVAVDGWQGQLAKLFEVVDRHNTGKVSVAHYSRALADKEKIFKYLAAQAAKKQQQQGGGAS